WPGKIEPGFSDELVVNQDLVATLASVVGTTIPKEQALDSMNLLPLLMGRQSYNSRKYLLLQAGSRNEVMFRKDGWKLILQSDQKLTRFDPVALFHLSENPSEAAANNKIDDPLLQKRIHEMRTEYLRIRESRIRTIPRS
ncbi:MAG: sulfatase, partial [Planctomycetota bacterium]